MSDFTARVSSVILQDSCTIIHHTVTTIIDIVKFLVWYYFRMSMINSVGFYVKIIEYLKLCILEQGSTMMVFPIEVSISCGRPPKYKSGFVS